MKIHELLVLPDAPKNLAKLQELAYNLYFSWNKEVTALYRTINEELWVACEKSPVRFLSEVSTDDLQKVAEDKHYIKELDRVYDNFIKYQQHTTWFEQQYEKPKKPNLAYFCCEYGMHESVPIYSGGLGVLAGDHIKTASDLGLPLVGVGLLYRSGYFSQEINQEGVQIEQYRKNNFYNIPIVPVHDEDDRPLLMSLDIADIKVWFDVWKISVGRVEILLLNTFVPQNSHEIQQITDKLYVGDRETRILQEYLLGVGGYKVLQKTGYDIEMFHINEGHSIFLLLEYMRYLVQEKKQTFDMAKLLISESTCFTTHTPVPAGNERFRIELMDKYFRNFAKDLGLSWELFLSLGREEVNNHNEEFCLTVMALKLCNRNNGVAKLHGKVSQAMWKKLYPHLPTHEVPIGAITNGVHGQTWTHSRLKQLLLDKAKKQNYSTLYDEELYTAINAVSDKELWAWKQYAKEELIAFSRNHLVAQCMRFNAGQTQMSQASEILDPNALTIGFARRFATYKRGNLFLRDRARLLKLLKDEDRPLQFLIAGKAHPADQMGKDIIRSIHTAAREMQVEHKIVFLENYNITVAQYLVSGVDVWLNNPIRPEEASGTSGMKAAINGALNVSISDGWWDEAYNRDIGWNLSSSVNFSNLDEQNNVEADILYHQLEKEILPTFFDRNEQGLPLEWIRMMKASIAQVGAHFNSVRMLKEYTHSYMEVVESSRVLKANDYKNINELLRWKVNVFEKWGGVKFAGLNEPFAQKIRREDTLQIEVQVELGNLKSEDVRVECYYGALDGNNEILDGETKEMTFDRKVQAVSYFTTTIMPNKGGKFGYTTRIYPQHELISNQFILGLMHWYE